MAFQKGHTNYIRKPRSKKDIERAVDIACKRLGIGALKILEEALDTAKTPELEYRWRIAAAKEILDRGYGRPKQTVESTVTFKSAEALVDAIQTKHKDELLKKATQLENVLH